MTDQHPARDASPEPFEGSLDYVTVRIGTQLLGLPIQRVRDVFIADRITVVPGAPPEIVGLLNLRGRVVTAICLRQRLRLPALPVDRCALNLTAIGLDHRGEAYALIVDAVGEVLRLDPSTLEPLPGHLDAAWTALASGVHRLTDQLLVVLDLDVVLDFDLRVAA